MKANSRIWNSRLGFISLEISLVLIISAVLTFFLLKDRIRDSVRHSAHVQADQLLQLQNALQSYVSIHGVALVNRSLINSVSTPLAPTVAELANLSFLPPNFSQTAVLNQSPFRIRLAVQPTACTLGNCVIDGYALVVDPFLLADSDPARGEYDGQLLGDMLSRIGGNAFARVVPNASLVAAGGNFSYANSADTSHPSIRFQGQPYPAGVMGVRIASHTPPAASNNDTTQPPTNGSTQACPAGVFSIVATNKPGGGVGNSCEFSYPALAAGESINNLPSTAASKVSGTVDILCRVVPNSTSVVETSDLQCVK